jgi:hypothetical protein
MHFEAVTLPLLFGRRCRRSQNQGLSSRQITAGEGKCKPKLRTGAQQKTTGNRRWRTTQATRTTSSLLAMREYHRNTKLYCAWGGLMYIFFLPSLLALIVIGSIQLRDQFRFTVR